MSIKAAYIVNNLKHGTHARFMTIHSDGLSPGEGGTKESASISEIVRVSQVESFTIYCFSPLPPEKVMSPFFSK